LICLPKIKKKYILIQKTSKKNLPINIGTPQIMPGTANPAIKAIPNGAPIKVPICHKSFFFRVQGFFPQNVQPVGLKKRIKLKKSLC